MKQPRWWIVDETLHDEIKGDVPVKKLVYLNVARNKFATVFIEPERVKDRVLIAWCLWQARRSIWRICKTTEVEKGTNES